MTTALHSAEQRVVLHNISWNLYETLLFAHRDCSAPRFTYDRGELEIMSPSAEHEQLTRTVALLVNIVAEEIGINVKDFGSTTFRIKDGKRGFEPDACFYIENLAQVRNKKELDLRIDPPPDIVIEIDITSSSINKLSIMAEVRVPEVWHYGKKGCRILGLEKQTYRERKSSASFPQLTPQGIAHLIEESNRLEPLAWSRYVRQWIRNPRQ